ncbi:MAG: nitrous oxide-stimulated promoter family protein [Pseudomonadota bacterium]
MTDSKTNAGRIEREKRTIEAMLNIYCSDHHQDNGVLCDECTQMLDYARQRLTTCPFQQAKPACNHCQVHCYAPEMRKRVKAVMRYAGPRMTLRYPLLSLLHLLDKLRKAPALGPGKK